MEGSAGENICIIVQWENANKDIEKKLIYGNDLKCVRNVTVRFFASSV